jgi:8-oxo-dGTP pyrophosphatase MutT (NUDIX family)
MMSGMIPSLTIRPRKKARQVAALPLRSGAAGPEICLVTTRQTRRWTLPKGWPMAGKKDHDAAAIEAMEEAGLLGRVRAEPVGRYGYWKHRGTRLDRITVAVYRLDVTGSLETWPEMHQREVAWFSLPEAESLVEEAGLQAIIAHLREELMGADEPLVARQGEDLAGS